MNQKKNTKILLIIIIVLFILILLAGGAFAYFATDLFKSDKELFFKYISQIGDSEKGFINNDLTQYFEKKNSTPYNNQGEFSVNISEDGNEDEFENVNNFNISFSGQVDEANKKAAQNISLNYSDDVNSQINYKQIDSLIGLQTSYVGNKFIAIDVNNLNKLSESNMTINEYTNSFEKIEKIGNVELNQEQLESIFNTYKNVLNEQMNSEWFSKVQEEKLTGYKLSLDGENLKNILIQLLETLKNDQTTLEKINEYLKIQRNSNKYTVSDIDDMIKDIQNNNNLDDQKVEITVYKNNNSLAKISIKVENTVVTVEKNEEKNSQRFKISIIDDETPIISINMSFEGLQSLQNIKENYELELNNEGYTSDSSYKYYLNNDINFTDVATIEEFTDQNSVILTNYESEAVNNFIKALIQRIKDVNKMQMEKLGLEEYENPIFHVIPSIGMYSFSGNSINGVSDEMSELAINTFNNKFEVYEGTNLSSQTVKGLLSTISLNNEDDENHKIKEINFEGEEYEASEQNITFVKSDIDMEKNYRVEFEKDQDTGIIYRVIINAR